jgi:hypothetical protein
MAETPKMPRTTTERSEPITFEIPEYVKLMDFPRIETQFVAILGHDHVNRGMIASPYHTRCIQQGQIHELVVVLENEEGLINLNDAWYLGFIEFKESCVLAKGMSAEIDGQQRGTLIGFDITHIPNHFNILIASKTPQTGRSAGVKIKVQCFFEMRAKSA